MLEVESEEALSEAKSSSIIIPPTPKLTQGEVYRLDRFGASELHTGGVMQSGKIKSLLNFLDHVDNTSTPSEVDSLTSAAALEQRRLYNVSAAVEEVTENIKDTQNKLNCKGEQIEILKSELSTTSNKTAQLQAQIFATKLESDEKAKAVAMLRRALDEQRDLTLRLTSEQEKDAQQRLSNQKTEYETTIQRHLGFIDQLIADKKDLSDKVETLMTQLRSTEKKLGDRVKLLEEGQKVEVKKQREAIEAAEKIKRERWIAEKSNKIKEMTVRGLEPEIQKLIAKNKAEIKRLNAVHEADLLAADERASKRFVAQVEELRKQLDDEKEAACTRERDNAHKRFEKQVEQEENAYQQQRRRLYAEVQEEKERAAELLNKDRVQLAGDRKAIEEEFNTKSAKVQAQHTLEMEKVQMEHDNTLRDLKLRIQVEKEQWLENQKQKQVAELMAKEREIRENLRVDRNKEIEIVISKLEEQAALQKEESQATLDCRMKRLKDKYESQIGDVEHLNNTTQSKLNVMKERVTDLEADNIRLRGHIKSLERQNEDLEKFSSRLKGERDKVEEVIRGEFSERLVTLEEENKNAKSELIECKTRHKFEFERQGRLHEDEMGEVQSRIKTAFAKRDELIKELRDKSGQASARADHLEALLIKQREQLLRPVPK
ncbi:centrosomal protein of 131 kDa-like isoform X2 [Bolinopsis microptera]|uniref:centrosomal protein of 131 kDa-like isoform X2 n=1 Tax=Bolinopsis microptera TaxID=2820187 RepID=UPI003079E5ED